MESKKFGSILGDFNSSLKLGIDVGLETGGIALVKGNKVLFAKTLVDFHENSLKNRRDLRRGRRTRRTKEKRLARLRSWVLRQKVNGKQLPDPYEIMKDPKFWVKFDEYKAKTKKAVNRVDSVIRGLDTSPEGFVRALTIIFQKRGYKSQGKEIQLQNKNFEDAIKNLEYPITEDRKNELLEEIIERGKEGELDERKSNSLKRKVEETYEKSKSANATDRKLVEERLEKLIHAFCTANKITSLEAPWHQQLKHILNKKIRKMRFNNRILINCSVCGIHTPLKKNVRAEEFKIALKNLRSGKGDMGYVGELQVLFDRMEEIRKKIAKPEKLKDGLESLHGEIKNIRKDFFDLYKKKALDENMKQQIEVLIFEPLSGRSRYCRKHLSEQVSGTLKLDYGKLSPNFTINPGFKNHDDRVINCIDKVLFHDKVVNPSEIRYISIEAPQPKTKRARPGKTTERNEEGIKERLKKEFDGKDIYSGEKLNADFEIDHIFPESRLGPSIQENYVPCNKSSNRDKNNRTPYEWLKGNPLKWGAFKDRVLEIYNKKVISERKKEILLNEEDEYPGENPTNLARVSGNISYFVSELQHMFKKHGLKEPEPNTSKSGALIQVTQGWLTDKLRWQWNAENDSFIPKKDVGNSANHAEDAAVIASVPPPDWRNRIFRYIIKNYVPDGGPHKGKKIDRPGCALPDIAPHWKKFLETNEAQMVDILGKNRVSWKNKFMDTTFGLDPSNLDVKKQSIHETKVIDGVKKRSIKHRSKGGSLMLLKPRDGPARQVMIKPKSNYVVLYKEDKAKKVKFLHGFIPPIVSLYKKEKLSLTKKDEEELKMLIELDDNKNKNTLRLYNHQIVKLGKDGKWPAGYYMINKLGKSISVIPEGKIKTAGEKATSKTGKAYNKHGGRSLKQPDFNLLLSKTTV